MNYNEQIFLHKRMIKDIVNSLCLIVDLCETI